MKKLILIVVCFMLVGCSTLTVSEVTSPNRQNLLKLSIGMNKAEVIEIMGTEPFYAGGYNPFIYKDAGKSFVINNPYRSEILQGQDKTLEIIYYVTDIKKDDDAITDDELTPLVFDEGKLIGWGWSFLEDNVNKYEIRIR